MHPKLLLVAGLFFAATTVLAKSQITVSEIVRTLDRDPFWTNRPITVRFNQTVEMYSDGPGHVTITNVSVYDGEGALTTNGFTAMASLARFSSASLDATGAPFRKFFVRSNDYTMSYFLYPASAASQESRRSAKTATSGEATIGVPACNCTEKFWSFPMTPEVLARKLEGLKDATCNPTNINGDLFVQVVGRSEDEKAAMWWHILLKKSDVSWLPVRTEVYFQNQLLSTIEASFNRGAGYSLNRIQLTLLRGQRVMGVFRWNNIEAMPRDEVGDRFSAMATIPSGVIVTDYRFKKPLIYVMQDSKRNSADSPRKVTRLNVPPAEKQKLPENAVQVVFVRLALIALAVLPIGWVPRVRISTPTIQRRSTALSRYFVQCAAVILGVTALAKVISVFSNAPLMLQADPLLEVPFRYLLLIAALAELAVVGACLFTKGIKRKVLLIAWLSSVFLVYRTGLWFIDWHRPCHCLGDLTEMLHIAPVVADDLMKGVLLFLLLGSYANLFFIWREEKQRPLPMEPTLPSENLVETL